MTTQYKKDFKVIGGQVQCVCHIVENLTTAPLFCFHNFILRFRVAVQTSTATFF